MDGDDASNTERGQALVLIVLALVALLGFAALAVDGSMIYSDRRYAQSGADSASLAGGSTTAQEIQTRGVDSTNWPDTNDFTGLPQTCQGQVLLSAQVGLAAAQQRGTDNEFTLDTDVSDEHGVKAECGWEPVTRPTPGGGQATIYWEPYVDILAKIIDETNTAFAHFVYGGELRNAVSAVTRVHPRMPIAYGNAIVALNPDDACNPNRNGLLIHGLGPGNYLEVEGGGIWSNGCLDLDGNPDVRIYDAGATYFYTGNQPDLEDIIFTPANDPVQLVNPQDNGISTSLYDIPMPDCTGHQVNSNWITGYFDQDRHNGGTGTIPSGLYCVTNELRINNNDTVVADGVTFVLFNGLQMNGTPIVHLTAPDAGYVGAAIPGLLIYQPPNIDSNIIINGNSDTTFTGAIVAPGSDIRINGDAGFSGLNSQVIGWNVEIAGSTTMSIVYDDSNPVFRPAVLDLYR